MKIFPSSQVLGDVNDFNNPKATTEFFCNDTVKGFVSVFFLIKHTTKKHLIKLQDDLLFLLQVQSQHLVF